MANQSTAYGTGEFISNNEALQFTWDEAHIKAFKTVFNTLNTGVYYTILDFTEPDSLSTSFIFNGTGRWVYQNNLEYMPNWISDNSNIDKKALKKLSDWMKENEAYVQVGYADEEAGNEILYTADGQIVPKNDSLVFIEQSTTNYEYNRDNLIDLDLYDEESFGIGVDEVYEALKEERHIDMNTFSDTEKELLLEKLHEVLNEYPWAFDTHEVMEEWQDHLPQELAQKID